MSVEADLVKQLRDAVALGWLLEAEGTLNDDTLAAAADEIERLRAVLARLDGCTIEFAPQLGHQVVVTPEPSWCKNASGLLKYLRGGSS